MVGFLFLIVISNTSAYSKASDCFPYAMGPKQENGIMSMHFATATFSFF